MMREGEGDILTGEGSPNTNRSGALPGRSLNVFMAWTNERGEQNPNTLKTRLFARLSNNLAEGARRLCLDSGGKTVAEVVELVIGVCEERCGWGY